MFLIILHGKSVPLIVTQRIYVVLHY